MTNNWQALADGLEGGLKDLLNEIIDGTIEDLDGPVREIASRLAFAAKRNKPEVVAECKDQLALLILEKELRLTGGFGDILEIAIGMGINALVSGAIGGLNAAKR